MLKIEKIDTYYGDTQVLWNLSLNVPAGSVVAILGRNGMGKTTTIRSVMGLTPPQQGAILFKDEDISELEPHQRVRRGIGYVPQGRGVFPSLTVKENLTIAERKAEGEDNWDLDAVYDLFPILKDRSGLGGSLLSGGEQQMLVVARALMSNPELLIMDEPSEGLAPLVIKEIGRVICRLKGKLTVFLAEQNLNMAMTVADHIYIINKGTVVHEGTPEALRDDEQTLRKWLGV